MYKKSWRSSPPGKGYIVHLSLPVFNNVQEAVYAVQPDVTVIYVPAPFCKEFIIEVADSEIRLIVYIIKGIHVMDMLEAKAYVERSSSLLIGPNCPGVITQGECKIGIMPGNIHMNGKVGIVSRSGTLTYEAVNQKTALGFGQSTCVGIGGDPISCTNFIDVLEMFQNDPQTEG